MTGRMRGLAALNGLSHEPGNGTAGCLSISRAPRYPAERIPIPVIECERINATLYSVRRPSPACQTILNVIGDLLADGCAVQRTTSQHDHLPRLPCPRSSTSGYRGPIATRHRRHPIARCSSRVVSPTRHARPVSLRGRRQASEWPARNGLLGGRDKRAENTHRLSMCRLRDRPLPRNPANSADFARSQELAFLQHRRLAAARREKKNQRATASANFASRALRHPRAHRSTTAAAMPALPKMDLQRAAA
jgi:hypothetical protein